MTFIDRRTFTMWLATIDTGQVSRTSAPASSCTYQCEAAGTPRPILSNEWRRHQPAHASASSPHSVETQAPRPRHSEERHRQGLPGGRADRRRCGPWATRLRYERSSLYIQDHLREKGATRDEVKRCPHPRYVREDYVAERAEPGKRLDETLLRPGPRGAPPHTLEADR